MYFSDLEFFVILFFVISEFVLGITSAYGWMVEYDKRKEAENRVKEMLNQEINSTENTSALSRDYEEYIKEIEKSIAKERSEKDVYL